LGDGEVFLVVYQAELGEVEDLDQAQALLGPVEAQAQAVWGQGDDDGGDDGVALRVGELDGGIYKREGFDAGEDVVDGRAEDCGWSDVGQTMAAGLPKGPREWPWLIWSLGGSAMVS
jgi:hypothetical protein